MSKPTKIWLAAGIILFILGVAIAAFSILDRWVEGKIKTAIREKIKAPNSLGYGFMEASFFDGTLVVKDVVATVYLGKWKRKAEIAIPSIRLEGIGWMDVVFSRAVNIEKLKIDNPAIAVSWEEKPDSLTREPTSVKAGKLKCVSIGQIFIQQGQFSFLKKTKGSLPEMEADTFNLELGELSLLVEKEGQPLSVVSADLDLYNFMHRDDNNLSDISFRHIHLSKKDSVLEVLGFRVVPKLSKRDFSAQLKYKKSRLELDFPSVKISGWQFDQLWKGKIVGRTVLFDHMKIGIFSDRNLPIDPNTYKPFPQEQLLKTSLGLTFDTIKVKDGWLIYENLGMDRLTPGRLEFESMEALLTNVTNDTARIRQQPVLEIQVDATLHNKYNVNQHLWMNLGSPSYAFTYTGNAANIPFVEFNAFLAPAHHFEFEAGTIQRLAYRINADKDVARGELTLEYEGLEFGLLDEKREKKKFLSKIVDLFFIDGVNTKGEKDFKKGEVYAVRNTRRSFYYFWWNAIQSGIKTSILSDKAIERMGGKQLAKKKKQKKGR